MGVGGTDGLDRAHVGSPGNGDRRSKWFRLIDKVWSPKNLESSVEKVVAKGGSAGVDNQTVRDIKVHKDQTVAKLEQELREAQYCAVAGCFRKRDTRSLRKTCKSFRTESAADRPQSVAGSCTKVEGCA
jgi:hypothetical protein